MVPLQVDTGFIINLPFWAPQGLERIPKILETINPLTLEVTLSQVCFKHLLMIETNITKDVAFSHGRIYRKLFC